MKKFKVLYIEEDYLIGGAEQQLDYLSSNIDRRFCCEFLALNKKSEFGREYERKGFKVTELGMKNLSNPFKLLSNISKLRQAVRKIKPDIIHTQLWMANFLGRVAGMQLKIPVISSERNVYNERKIYHKLIDKWLSRHCEYLIANSKGVAKFTSRQEGIPLGRFTIIYNGLDFSRFDKKKKNLRKEFGIGKDEIVLVNVGSLTVQKGQKCLLSSFRKLVDHYQGRQKLRLLIVGSGHLEKSLKKQAEALGLLQQGLVIFTGNRRDIPDILSSSDIFVFPSLYEGLPNAVMEAMAMKLPVVAFDAIGTDEIVVDGKTGILVPMKDTDSFAEAAAKLAHDKRLRAEMGKQGSVKIKEFSLAKMIKSYNSIYISIMKKQGKI